MDRYQILTLLRDRDAFCSGEEMARQLGVSRAAVWKGIQQLREEGYEIQSITNRGYRLQGGEVLSPQEIQARLGDCPLGRQLWVLPAVPSTNSFLKLQAEQGAPDGSVAIANCQEQGRGRRGRAFYSPPGEGLYLSVLFRGDLQVGEVGLFTAGVALAVADAIQDLCGVRPQIKWPNDLLWQGKKLCGILTETSVESESGQVLSLVCGIGINVNNRAFPPPVDQVAVSLYQLVGRPLSRVELACGLLRQLEVLHRETPYRRDPQGLLDRYRRDLAVLDRPLLVLTSTGQERVWGLDVDSRGGLVIRGEDGAVRTLYSGDVSIRPQEG